LPKLNRDKLPLKTLNDFYSMICIDLSKNRTPEFVLKIALLCEEFVSIGDERAAFWKEVLPIALTVLQKHNSIIEYERKSCGGKKHCQEIIERILLNSPPISALTAFVSMFK
jgi:FANCI solenoid 1